MMKIQANPSGTRTIEITGQHLQTIDRYALLTNLTDSSGIVDEEVLEKLKLNVRSLLEGEAGKDRDLLDLCLDVIYNSNMKALACTSCYCSSCNGKSKTRAKRMRNADRLSSHDKERM